MRVLVTGLTSNYGGVEAFVMNYYREMKKIDSNLIFDLLGYTDHPAYEKEIIDMGGNVYCLPSPKNVRFGKLVREFFHKHGHEYDAIWCNKCDLHDIAFLRAAKNIPKRILHAHNSNIQASGLKKFAFTIMHHINKLRIGKIATDYWACSDWAAQWLFPSKTLHENKVIYIPNAIDLNLFRYSIEQRHKYRETYGWHGMMYGCVGTLSKQKNPLFAIQTFAEIWKENTNSYLLMIGKGEQEQKLKLFVQTLACKNNIFFLGMRHDVPQLMQAMDCYLMPSLFEGFPVATIEAQAAGLPVFGSSDGITPQAQLTDLFHFLPLSLGPEGWAEQIMASDLTRKDRQQVLREKGFDITLAANHLLAELKK